MERFIFGTLISLALAGAVATGSQAVVAAPAPTPAALQYEQITRVEIPPTTPIPVGVFETDRAAIIAAVGTPPPQHHGLFGGIENAMQTAQSAMAMIHSGILTRYTYYNNWVREDDVAHQTATITKCTLHQYITLDYVHHTYTITSTVPTPAPAAEPESYHQTATTEHLAPGTEDMTINVTSQNLGPRTIEGINTHGASSSLSIVMANATGSCSNGSMSMQMTTYQSGIGIPRAYCPLPRVSGMPAQSSRTFVTGGCKPRFHGSMAGAQMVMGGNGNTLAMYTRGVWGGAQTQGQNIGFVTETGNVRWLSRAEADALFSIPPGFTQSQ